MPRNSSGTYALYTPGNPVVTNTVISSTWANNSLADIASALTDSLSRTGDGGMQAPLELTNGAIGAPSLTWAAEPTSGWYRAGSGDFRFSVSAADVLRVRAGLVTITGQATGNTLLVTSPATAGSSFGLAVIAGTNASDYAMLLQGAGGPDLMRVYGTGGVLLSSATGGQQGLGTINAVGVYDDGVLLANQTGANPTATVGTSAVNGSAGTFMRSDGAPALNLAITPTWTGAHTWSGTSSQILTQTASSTTAFIAHYLQNDAGDFFRFALAGSANVTAFTTNGPTGPAGYFYTTSTSMPISVGTNGIERMRVTDTSVDVKTDLTFTVSSVAYSAGYRGLPSRSISSSDSTAALDNGRTVLFTGAGSQTFTVDSDFGTAGNVMVLLNGGSGSLSVAESLSGTMTWLNGSGTLATGSRTLAIGGIATIWMVDATNAYIWGTGLT